LPLRGVHGDEARGHQANPQAQGQDHDQEGQARPRRGEIIHARTGHRI